MSVFVCLVSNSQRLSRVLIVTVKLLRGFTQRPVCCSTQLSVKVTRVTPSLSLRFDSWEPLQGTFPSLSQVTTQPKHSRSPILLSVSSFCELINLLKKHRNWICFILPKTNLFLLVGVVSGFDSRNCPFLKIQSCFSSTVNFLFWSS